MHISSLVTQVKNTVFPSKQIGFEEYVNRHKKFGFWLRPASDLQSEQMVSGYLRAVKDDLENGGYIFVKKSRAACLLRQLAELQVDCKPVHFQDMSQLSDILDLDDPKALWVVIEDDSLPYAILVERLHTAEKLLRSQMAPPLGDRIEGSHDQIMAKAVTRKIKVLMFIEMDYPSIRGFSVVLSQSRNLKIAACRVTRECMFDRQVHATMGEPEHVESEITAMAKTTIRIYGSGDKYQAEIKEDLKRLLQYQATQCILNESAPEGSSSIDADQLTQVSSACLAFGFEDAEVVDLNR